MKCSKVLMSLETCGLSGIPETSGVMVWVLYWPRVLWCGCNVGVG